MNVDDAARLRRLLRSSSSIVNSEHASTLLRRALVLVDHHEARIYRIGGESGDQPGATVRPDDPYGFHRHLIHRKEAHYRGERVPEDESYFRHIGESLSFADEIVLVGHGKGKSNEAFLLLEFLQAHDPSLAHRITAVEDMDLSSLSEAEIEQRLRER